MGFGEGIGEGAAEGAGERRRTRRARKRRLRRRRRRGRRASAHLFLCCFGAATVSPEANQRDIEEMNVQMVAFMEQLKQRQQQQQLAESAGLESNQPVNLRTTDMVYMTGMVTELQSEQQQMLDDLLKQQSEEKDPEKLAELCQQQNEVNQQMRQLRTTWSEYDPSVALSAPKAETLYSSPIQHMEH